MLNVATVVVAASMVVGQGDSSNYERLRFFEPMIGTWCHEGETIEATDETEKGSKLVVHWTWKWILDKNAIETVWKVEAGNQTTHGKSLIGWDASEKRFVEGGMASNGAIFMGHMSPEAGDKTWTRSDTGVDDEGRKTSAKIVITIENDDAMVFQVRDRKGGDLTGDSPKYHFVRCEHDHDDDDD